MRNRLIAKINRLEAEINEKSKKYKVLEEVCKGAALCHEQETKH